MSVIILNYNGKEYLKKCLLSLQNLNYPKEKYEVVIVDNFSEDDSVLFIKDNYPFVSVLELGKNYGFGGGNNRGVKIAKGEYIAFLNNDTVVDKNWLRELVLSPIKNKTGIAGSKTIFYDNPTLIEYAGGKIALNGRTCNIYFGKKNFAERSSRYTGYPCAASMLIEKDVFIKIGGFDEDYFAQLDDSDLGWRAWVFGYPVFVVPTSVVYHKSWGTGKKIKEHIRGFHMTKNAIMSMLKNFSSKKLLIGLILEMGYDFIEIFYVKKLSFLAKKINAYVWVIRNFTKILNKRRQVQVNRRVSDEFLVKNGVVANIVECFNELKHSTNLKNL